MMASRALPSLAVAVLVLGLVAPVSFAFTTGPSAAAGRPRLAPPAVADWRTAEAAAAAAALPSPAAARRLPSSLSALPRAAAAAGPMTPTALSAALTLVLASDVLVRMVKSRRATTTAASSSSTRLGAASLEEATLYRPWSPDGKGGGDGTTAYPVPSLFTPADSRPVVLFDGSCNLCNWGVQLLLDHDSCTQDARGNLRIAALQSRVGQLLVERLNDKTRGEVLRYSKGGEDEKGDRYKTIVVCGPNRTWTNTAAILKMGRSMNFPFRPLALVAWLIPPFVRNLAYRWLSRNRKRLFGERAECRLWDDRWDTRFVDDSLLGGEGSGGGDDPFADPNAPTNTSSGNESAGEDVVLQKGDQVRVTSPDAVVVRHVDAFPDGVSINGCTGAVTEVNANNVVVQFDVSDMLGADGADASSEGDASQFQAYVTKDQVTKIQ